MIKKVIGIILLIFAGLAIVGGIANGTLFSVPDGSSARVTGNIFGQLVGYGLLIGGGIALINSSKK